MAGGTAPELVFYQWPRVNGTTRVITPQLYGEENEHGITLIFKQTIVFDADDYKGNPFTLKVEASKNFDDWTTLWEIKPTTSVTDGEVEAGEVHSDLNFSAGPHEPFYLAWTFEGDTYNVYWLVDDIKLIRKVENPTFEISPTSHDFGTVRVDTSASQSFTIRNLGINPLIIQDNGISLEDNDEAAFSFSLPEGTTYPISITNIPLIVEVTFTPTERKTYNAELVIVDNMSRATHEISLDGEGFDPTIRTFPYIQDFEDDIFPPEGWEVVNEDGDGTCWESTNNENHTEEGENSAFHGLHWNTQYDWLITPPIVLPASGKYQLGFWDYYIPSSGGEKGEYPNQSVLINTVNTVPDDGWEILWPPEYDGGEGGEKGAKNDDWEEHNKIDLAAYAGKTVFLAFHYQGSYAGQWYVDDICIEEYYDLYADEGEYTVHPETNTTVSITGGNANVDTSIDVNNLPPWNNTEFIPPVAFRLELFGGGPWELTIHTEALYLAYYYNRGWHYLEVVSGMVTFTIDSAKGDEDIDVIMGDENPGLPVTLSSFTATIHAQNYVQLTWITQTETGVMGFYVYRSPENELNRAEKISDLIPGTNTSQAHSYVYLDKEIYEDGLYYYWLENVDFDGSNQFHGPVSIEFSSDPETNIPDIPLVTQIRNVYPNPFNPNTRIPYELSKESKVMINIFNIRGQLVKSYPIGTKKAGRYHVDWDGKGEHGENCASGIYYIKMRAGDKTYSTKAVMLK